VAALQHSILLNQTRNGWVPLRPDTIGPGRAGSKSALFLTVAPRRRLGARPPSPAAMPVQHCPATCQNSVAFPLAHACGSFSIGTAPPRAGLASSRMLMASTLVGSISYNLAKRLKLAVQSGCLCNNPRQPLVMACRSCKAHAVFL
jgi:hypothetical protein